MPYAKSTRSHRAGGRHTASKGASAGIGGVRARGVSHTRSAAEKRQRAESGAHAASRQAQPTYNTKAKHEAKYSLAGLLRALRSA